MPVVMEDGAASRSQRQRLAIELRRLRDLAGLTGRELAKELGISQSKVSRIESGAALPTAPEVADWAEAVRASSEAREVLAALTEAAFTEVYTWQTLLQGRPHNQDEIQEMEHHARRILTFQSSMVPGLLQTAEYARRVLTLFHPPYDESDIPAAVAGRLDRQLALYEEHRRFEFLITEAALRWRPGPPRLLRAQLDRLASVSTLSNVSIGLIPHAVEALVSITHPFVLLEDKGGDGHDATADDPADVIVTMESIHSPLTVQDQASVSLYRTHWSLLRQMAVFGDDARRFLAQIADEPSGAGT